MGVINVVTRPIHEGLISGNIFLLIRSVLFTINLKASSISKWVFLVIVPKNTAFVVLGISIDQKDTTRDWIKILIVLNGDPIFDLRSHNLGYGHSGS